MVSDPRTVCGRVKGRAVAAPGEEGAMAVQPAAFRRAGAVRARAAQSKGWGCPEEGLGLPCTTGCWCKRDREQGLQEGPRAGVARGNWCPVCKHHHGEMCGQKEPQE